MATADTVDLVGLTLETLSSLKRSLGAIDNISDRSERLTRLRSRAGVRAATTRAASRSTTTATDVKIKDKGTFAKSILDAGIVALDNLKSDTSKSADKTRKYVYEASSAAVNALQSCENRPSGYEDEKSQLNFILKLIDNGLVEESLEQMWNLYQHTNRSRKSAKSPRANYEHLLRVEIPSSHDIALVNVIIALQTLLLKCVLRCADFRFKPLSNSIIASCMRDKVKGPLAWCELLSPSQRDQKLSIMGRLLMGISNTTSLLTGMQLRIAALLLLPSAEPSFYTMLWSSYDCLQNQRGGALVVKEFGEDIIAISKKHASSRFSDQFQLILESCNQVVLENKDLKVEGFWSHDPEFDGTAPESKNILEVVQTIQSINPDLGEKMVLGILNALPLQDHLSDPEFHKAVYARFDCLLSARKLDLAEVLIKEVYWKYSGKMLSTRYVARLLEKLLVFSKTDTSPSAKALLSLYEQFISIFIASQSPEYLLHISNSLLNIGARLRKSADNTGFVDFWSRSFDLDLEHCYRNSDVKSALSLKAEKLALAHFSKGESAKAKSVLTLALDAIIERHLDQTVGDWLPPCLAFDDADKLIILFGKIIIDTGDVAVIDTKHVSLIGECLLHSLSRSQNSKRNKPAKILTDYLWRKISPKQHPLRSLRVALLYFKIEGTLYDGLRDSMDEIFEQLRQSNVNDDESLRGSATLLSAHTRFSIAITQTSPTKEFYSIIKGAVDDITQDIHQGIQHIEDIGSLVSQINQYIDYLNLQGIPELRIKLLQTLICISKQASHPAVAIAPCIRFHVELVSCYLQLGYSGAARKEITIIKSLVREASLPDLRSIDRAWVLCTEAIFLVDTNDIHNAKESMTKFNHYVQDSPELCASLVQGKGANESTAHYEDRVLLYARSTIAFARMASLVGHSEAAVVNAQKAVRFLQSFLKREPPRTWVVSSHLIECMMLTARLFERIGVVREASYYIQEVTTVAKSAKCPLRLSAILTFDGELNVRVGKFEKAKNLLTKCEDLLDGAEAKGLDFLQLIHSLALFLQRQNMFSEEKIYYEVSDQMYSELVEKSSKSSQIDELAEQVSKMRLSAKPQKRTASSTSSQPSNNDTLGLDVVHNGITRSKIHSLGLQDSIDGAMELLEQTYDSAVIKTSRENILFEIARSRNSYLMAKKLLTLDPVFNVIQDSALSLPSVQVATKTRKVGTSTKSKLSKNFDQIAGAMQHLRETQSLLISQRAQMLECCSSIEISEVANLLNNISILLNAVSKAHDIVEKNCSIELLEVAKGYSGALDRRAMSLKRDVSFGWPNKLSLQNDAVLLGQSVTGFDNMEFLPADWLVISLNVSSDSGNIIITRYEKGQDQPFLLSLPLNRHNSRDADEQSFSFDDGLQQLNDIIAASNSSAHLSRTSKIKTKEDRQEWWEERFALDKQLQGLLHDVEYCWFGGFRGIFDPYRPDKVHAVRFREQVKKILDNHLPSRSIGKGRSGKSAKKGSPVDLHTRIYDLFMSIGDPEEFADPGLLEDLIYFVLDILQFHGEQNAYDELDLDQMVVEFNEAISSYMSKVRDQDNRHQYKHTVLLLDKKCRQFPWESIPLLRNTSVSRVPSLGVLHDALTSYSDMAVRGKGNGKFQYILNPGRDLLKTQERFQETFESLSYWQGQTAQAPTEDQFASALETSDAVIYMGHGGGEQYIRSAKIKSLNRCAPTFLLGCSSGALEYCGEYESWGTPMNYMIAGCPMLVANMWDVTDKDTDKFSMRMLEKWGVLANPGDESMDIARAIVECRDECTLRYLNGGAPVVYGLPLRFNEN